MTIVAFGHPCMSTGSKKKAEIHHHNWIRHTGRVDLPGRENRTVLAESGGDVALSSLKAPELLYWRQRKANVLAHQTARRSLAYDDLFWVTA